MPFVTVAKDVQLNYRVAGAGPTLLFHPGFANNLDLWNWVVRELAPTRTCVTFDPRGHGQSDKPDSTYPIDELATDVHALIEALDLSELTLVGHSLGGAVALQTVLEHDRERVRKVALLAPAAPCFLRQEGMELGMPPDVFAKMRTDMADNFVARMLGVRSVFFHQTDEQTALWLMSKTLDMPMHLAERCFAQLGTIDFRSRLKEIDVPVLAVWGVHDQMADLRWVQWLRDQELPAWTVEMLDHSGHAPMVDEPVAVADRLWRFTASTDVA